MTIMCDTDTNSAQFFRPWKSEDASCVKLNTEEGLKCHPRQEDDEEEEEEDEGNSVSSLHSVASSNASSGSVVSEVSEISEDSEEFRNEDKPAKRKHSYENRHLDLLNKFVNQTNGTQKFRNLEQSLKSKPKTETQDSGRSSTRYPRCDFLGTSFGASAFSPVPVAKNLDSVYFPDFQSCMVPQFCYNSGFSGESFMALAQNNYASVEDAVKFIHQQDLAVKQMKKLRPKKFRCEHCDVAFSNNGQLKGHVRIHTGERPFKCDADGCGKSFTRNEELTRHKRIHTGVRPHACSICGKRFGRKDHLKKHTRTHENRGSYAFAASTMNPFVSPFSYLAPTLPGTYPYPVL